MKRFIFLLFLPLGLFAQYVPFPEDSATWTYHGWEATSPPAINRYHEQLKIVDQVMADSLLVVKCRYKERFNTSTFYYRNDTANKKVYGVSVDLTKPHGSQITNQSVWYDFGINVGDTVSGNAFAGGNAIAILDSISYKMINGDSLRHFHFTSYNMPGGVAIRNFQWIEGIGSTWELMNPVQGPYFEFDESLECFQSMEYPYSLNPGNLDTGECWSPTFNFEERTLAKKIEIFPNPSTGKFYVKLPSGDKRFVEDMYLLDVAGRRMNYESTDLGNGLYELDLSLLSEGVYFLYLGDDVEGQNVLKLVKE